MSCISKNEPEHFFYFTVLKTVAYLRDIWWRVWEQALIKSVNGVAFAAENAWWLGNNGRTTSVLCKDVSLYPVWTLGGKDLAIF